MLTQKYRPTRAPLDQMPPPSNASSCYSFFWYRLTRVVPDKFHRAVKRLCVFVFGIQKLDIPVIQNT